MTRNASDLDRIARAIVGLALVVLYVFDVVGLLGLAGGIALIASGAVGWCAVYGLFGHSTCRVKAEN